MHLDGYDYLPFFRGEVDKAPRDTIYYFGQGGELNAIRWGNWKVHFAIVRWYADNLWLFVPMQEKLKAFFTTIPQYPFQEGASLTAGGINYNSLKAMKAMDMLKELGERFPINQ